ncbi:MAG: hypothetical protein AAGN66_28305 [Acidobacteriota bacterium]
MSFLIDWVFDNIVLFGELVLATAGIAITWSFAKKTNRNLESMQVIEGTLASKVERIGERSDEMAESLEAMRKLEKDLDERVLNIEDATRRLLSGIPEVIESILKFLRQVDPEDSLYVMTDTAAVGEIHFRNAEALKDYQSQGRQLKDDLNDVRGALYDCALHAEQFFITTLDSEPDESSCLMEKFAHPVLKALGESIESSREFLGRHVEDHNARIHELQEARKGKMRDSYVDPHLKVSDLPLQLFIRSSKEKHRRRALVIFAGTYNMERINEVRAMNTKDPKLVETFVSMYETISGLDAQLEGSDLNRRSQSRDS